MANENWIIKGHGKNAIALPVVDNVPADDHLEMMAGANKWHQVARDIFIESFLSEGKHGGNLSLVDNAELAERLLHEGKQIIEGETTARGGFSTIAKELYEEYIRRVEVIGKGDVSEYAKKASGKTRAELWGF